MRSNNKPSQESLRIVARTGAEVMLANLPTAALEDAPRLSAALNGPRGSWLSGDA
jgi:hypothetical protein